MNPFPVYSLYDIEPIRGEGCCVYTADGTEYLDLYGGHAVISIGHSHPKYISAITNQVSKLGFYSNSVKNSLQTELARRIGIASGFENYYAFFVNSGAEANENAFKLASFQTGRRKILAIGNAFHGRTSGAVAATDNATIRSPFNETDAVDFVALNDTKQIEDTLSSGEYAAVIIEGIQGVSGIHEPSVEFMSTLMASAHKNGTMVISDEIQSGYGRTGKFFAFQHIPGFTPDIITCAKGIANGFPMGAVLISPEFTPVKSMLGTTFGGNHLGCAAAISVLDVIESENLIENAAEVGGYLISELNNIPQIKEVRGKGLMIGVEISGDAASLRKELLFNHHIFTGGAGKNVIRLLPALSINMNQAKHFINTFKNVLAK